MTDLRKAAQQALEALEKATRFMSYSDYERLDETIDALRAALAEQPAEQEPVGVLRTLVQIHADGTETWREEPVWNAPPQRKPLTEEEIGRLTTGDGWSHLETPALALFARAIEQAHGIK